MQRNCFTTSRVTSNMAVVTLWKVRVFLGVMLMILVIVPDVQCRRSGSSRGSRGGRIFSVRRTSRTSRLPTYTSGQIRKGTSPFSSSTFRAALVAGTIYGSVRYRNSLHYHRHPDYIPPICKNIVDKPPNSSQVYGYFICPLEDEPDNYTWCCGPSTREICCDANYYKHLAGSTSSGTSPFIIVGLIVAVIVVIAIAVICYRQRKAGRKLLKSFSKKSSSNGGATELTDPHLAMPLKEYEPPPAYPEQGGAPMPYGETKSGYPPSDVQYPVHPETYPPAGPYPPPGAYPAPTGPYPAPAGPYPAPAGPYPPSAEPYPQETSGIAPYPSAPGPYPHPTASCPSDAADGASVPYGTAPYPAGPEGTPQPPSYGQFGGYGTQYGYSS